MQVLQIAQQVFRTEAQAILSLQERLNTDFEQAAHCLARCQGRVIVCGMGKSGLMGQKIAATLSSVGLPSHYLHPADALHGDLGILQAGDCFLSISNSGETDEILRLLPHIQRLALPHISLVGEPNSTLARHAHWVLHIGVSQEAAALSAVPMASMATTLAMGDALTAAVMQLRNFKQQDFARLHPAGSIGLKLVTQVSERMQKTDLPLVAPQAAMAEVVLCISAAMLGLAVVAEQGNILGVITDGDLRRALKAQPNEAFFQLKAIDIMTHSPKKIAANASLLDAEESMAAYKITALLVVNDQEHLVGIIAKQHFK